MLGCKIQSTNQHKASEVLMGARSQVQIWKDAVEAGDLDRGVKDVLIQHSRVWMTAACLRLPNNETSGDSAMLLCGTVLPPLQKTKDQGTLQSCSLILTVRYRTTHKQ